jgi:hypothetical protein
VRPLHNLNYAANILFAEVERILVKNNNAKEDNNIDRSSLLLLSDSNRTEIIDTLIREMQTPSTTQMQKIMKSLKRPIGG